MQGKSIPVMYIWIFIKAKNYWNINLKHGIFDFRKIYSLVDIDNLGQGELYFFRSRFCMHS